MRLKKVVLQMFALKNCRIRKKYSLIIQKKNSFLKKELIFIDKSGLFSLKNKTMNKKNHFSRKFCSKFKFPMQTFPKSRPFNKKTIAHHVVLDKI